METFREITEDQASGAVREIYDDVRKFYAAPYVSSLFRHLATYPGLLEWVWEIMAPGFTSGTIQHTGWNRVDLIGLEPLDPISRTAMRGLGVDANGQIKIANICRTFTRVSPINLVVAGCLSRLLTGDVGMCGTTAPPAPVALPTALPKLPGMVSWEELDANQRSILGTFKTDLAGESFVPGLYRILARWPGYLTHVSIVLGPRLSDPVTLANCKAIADRIGDAASKVLAFLEPPTTNLPLSTDETTRVLAAIQTYRGTSPQMIGFGTLLLNALPKDSAGG